MKVIKKSAIMTLCIIIIISSMAITAFSATTKTEINNAVVANFTAAGFPTSPRGYLNTDGRNAEVTATFITGSSGAENDYAAQFDVTAESGAIKISNPPDYTQIMWTGAWNRNATYISYDFKINSFAEAYINKNGEDEGKIMGIDVRDEVNSVLNGRFMGGDKKTTVKTDGSVGDSTYVNGKWYNMKVVFNFKTHKYCAYLTDKETNEVTTVAKYEEIDARARNMAYFYVEFYRPCSVTIDALKWGEIRDFGIYPWSITNNNYGAINDGDVIAYSGNKIAVGVPADAKSAALYLDDVKQSDIPVGTSKDGIYKIGYNAAYVGEHIFRLEMTDVNDNVYTDTYSFKDATAYSVYKSRDYDFANGTAYWIGNNIGGGVGNLEKATIVANTDVGTTSFSYNAEAGANSSVYVRGSFEAISYGVLDATYRMKLMQNDIDVKLSYEERKPDMVEKAVTVFTANGTLGNTGIPYYADTWYDVTFKFNTTAGTADVFVNNIYVTTSTFNAGSGILGYLVYLPMTKETAAYEIDHFSMNKYADAPAVTSVAASKDGAALGAVASDSDTLTFTLDGALVVDTVVSENVSLVCDGETVSTGDIVYNADANTITVPVSGLKPLTKATLSLNTAVSNADNFFYHKPFRFAFDVALPTVITVDNFAISNQENVYSASADIYYPLDDGKTAMLLIAGYEGNKMVAVNFDEKVLVNNDKNAFEVSQDMTGASEVKAFVWYKGSFVPFCVGK